MEYCITIHSAMFPSIVNCPPGYVCYSTDSHNAEVSEECASDKTELDNQASEVCASDKTKLDNEVSEVCASGKTELDNEASEVNDGMEHCKNKKINGEFENVSDRENSDHIKGYVKISRVDLYGPTSRNKLSNIEADACGCVNVTDYSTYWDYYDLSTETICDRLTNSKEHLEDVFNLLKRLNQNLDTDCHLSDEYDISISDDEYIDQLEKDEPILGPKREIVLSDQVKKCLANENCYVKNKVLGDQALPENLTDEEILKIILTQNLPSDGDYRQCEVCDGKKHSFTKNWMESFHEKYPDFEIFTDVI